MHEVHFFLKLFRVPLVTHSYCLKQQINPQAKTDFIWVGISFKYNIWFVSGFKICFPINLNYTSKWIVEILPSNKR